MFGRIKRWFGSITFAKKCVFIVMIIVICGVASASAEPDTSINQTKTNQKTPDATQVAPPPNVEPVVEEKETAETRTIAFAKRTVDDASLEKGKTYVRTAGVNGEKKITYVQSFKDGVAIGDKKFVKEEITRAAVDEITVQGTKVARVEPTGNCDRNYSGCVPVASDVDCAGGTGNGPAYVAGPVRVIGSDIYGLDRDGNGIACE